MIMLPMLPPLAEVRAILRAAETEYGVRLTFDGHAFGQMGEIMATRHFDLTSHPASTKAHDAYDKAGRQVQVKITQRETVALRHDCERLIVMRVSGDDCAEVVYDGPGAPAWANAGNPGTNGQRSISLSKLRGFQWR